MASTTSSRWCPTPEQLMILEEMYKSGVRTPNASQILKITAHLSFYGKIEGKNVFYWFQNHKARDRQKLRRKLTKQRLSQDHQLFITNQNMLAQFPPSCFAIHQPSHSSPNYLHQVGGAHDGSFHAQMTNFTWKLDTQKLQNMGTKSNVDDWMMMMMLKEACGTSTCCSKKMTRPLKTLDLFPINSPSQTQSVKEKEEQKHCTTSTFRSKNGSSSVLSLDIMLTSPLSHNTE